MLHYNKTLYSAIYEEIHNIEIQISNYREIISTTKGDLEHVDSRILQAKNENTHEYIPAMVSIRKYLFHRQQIHQNLLDMCLNSISEIRKNILSC